MQGRTMESNLTKEQVLQLMVEMQQQSIASQGDEISTFVVVFYLVMWTFASIGIYATIWYIARFIKNGFKLKKEQTVTKYVYIDSYMGMAFFAFIVSALAITIGRAYAIGAIGQ
jgi:hypothetical protein